MEEIVIKLDMSDELARILKPTLEKALKDIIFDLKFSIADAITSKSTLTEKQIKELSDEIKESVAKRHGLKI